MAKLGIALVTFAIFLIVVYILFYLIDSAIFFLHFRIKRKKEILQNGIGPKITTKKEANKFLQQHSRFVYLFCEKIFKCDCCIREEYLLLEFKRKDIWLEIPIKNEEYILFSNKVREYLLHTYKIKSDD